MGTAQASETIESVQQKLEMFTHSADYMFAPATATKAQAYLGAAMLAKDEEKTKESEDGLTKALAILNEARENARQFRQKFAEVLKLKKTAEITFTQLTIEDPLKEPNPKQLLQQGDDDLNKAIKHFESGQLGKSQQSAENAKISYKKAIAIALPYLADETGSILSKASAAGAKKYAPKTYEKAKTELTKIERFTDGLTLTPPTSPTYALTLAEQALKITQQTKVWRKTTGSHEELVLNARNHRLKLAQALKISVDSNNANADVSTDELASAITDLQNKLTTEKEAHQTDLTQLRQKHKKELEMAVAQQRTSLLSEQNEQLSNLKEAFRAKLERETFQAKRQKKIRSLFKKGEAEILVNLDTSLLIRLSKLKFSSGSSKIDPASFALLGKLKDALAIYGERSVRIEGHTDNTGDVKLNQKISLQRAEAVRDFLIAASMDGSRIKALGYGEVRPIASNEFTKGRALNRRIDIVIEAQHN